MQAPQNKFLCTGYIYPLCTHKVIVQLLQFVEISTVKRLLLIKDCIHEDISNILNLKNASYHAVLKLLCSHLPPKNLKYYNFKMVLLSACCMWLLTQSLGLSKGLRECEEDIWTEVRGR
jgi:hypothetical protein